MDDIRTMPWSAEAELAVLGSMFIDVNCISDVVEVISADDFYMPRNKELFEAMCDLNNTGKPIEIGTLKEQLILRGSLERIGGLAFIAEVTSSVFTSSSVKFYIDIMEQKSTLRKLISSCNEILSLSYAGERETTEIVDIAEKAIFNIIEGRSASGFVHIRALLDQNIDKLSALADNPEKSSGLPTGFIDLDKMTSGLQPSDLVLIAGRTSMGKTTFALNIAQNTAVDYGNTAAIFSLEMAGVQIASRMLAAQAMVSTNRLMTGNLREEDWIKIAEAMERLCDAPIYIDDTSGVTVPEIAAKCRKLKLEKGLGVVVIDYLQLVRSGGKRYENRQAEVAEMSRSLKILARELNVPIIALSQLSREPEKRGNHKPMLSDLRESGAIEQDADLVMFLYRDDYYNDESEEPNTAECIIAKHRNGEVGSVKLAWLGEYTKFANLTWRKDV